MRAVRRFTTTWRCAPTDAARLPRRTSRRSRSPRQSPRRSRPIRSDRWLCWLLYPEGTFQFLDGGRLDLGVCRDSTLDATNDYESFVEVSSPSPSGHWRPIRCSPRCSPTARVRAPRRPRRAITNDAARVRWGFGFLSHRPRAGASLRPRDRHVPERSAGPVSFTRQRQADESVIGAFRRQRRTPKDQQPTTPLTSFPLWPLPLPLK